MSRGTATLRQSGLIPYRRTESGLDVLLIVSRNSGNWIVPKGHLEPGLSPRESARNEAIEEAGVDGNIGLRSIRGSPMSAIPCTELFFAG